MSLDLQDYFTADEVAARFQVKLKTVYVWAKASLPSERHRGMHYFRKEAVLSFRPPRGRYQRSRR